MGHLGEQGHEQKSGSAQKAPPTISTRAEIPMYVNSAHTPKNPIPATHSTNNTTCTGNSRNHSKARPPIPVDTISVDTGGAALLGGSVLGSVLAGSVLDSVLDFVVGCLVRIPHTSSLAELLLLRGVRGSVQVVSWVAGPGLGGGQVAVWPSYASFTLHATVAAYYGVKRMYVR
jgi:hypothetical protein